MTWEGWTVDDVMELGPRLPGYPRDRVEALWGGRERLGILEVCDLDIPAMDRLWLLCKAPWSVIAPAIFAIVERSVRDHALSCGVPEIEAWAGRWLSGEDRSEESAARAAEWSK